MSTAQRRKSFLGTKTWARSQGPTKLVPYMVWYRAYQYLSMLMAMFSRSSRSLFLSLLSCSRIGFIARSQMQPSLSNRRVAKPEEPSLSVLDEAIARYNFKFTTQNGRLWCVNAPDYSEERTPDGRSKTIRAMAFTRAVRVLPIVFSPDAYRSTSITSVFGRKWSSCCQSSSPNRGTLSLRT